MFKHILMAVANPEVRSSVAVNKAADLALAMGARLELFHDMAAPVLIEQLEPGARGLAKTQHSGTAAALRALERLAKPLRTRGVPVTTTAVWDYPPHEAIVRQAVHSKADLVVIDPQHRHRLPGLMGYNDWELLRECPVPLLLIKSRRPLARAPILAAVDPSHAYAKTARLDAVILRTAADCGASLRGAVHVVHAFQSLSLALRAAAAEDAQLAATAGTEARRQARVRFDKLLSGSGVSPRHRHLVESHPVDAIAGTVRRLRCGLLVMGSVSRSGLKRLFIGNTAERLLDDVVCDVLVVRTPDFSNRVPRRSRGLRLLSAAALTQQPIS
jgi:universal stress protein E